MALPPNFLDELRARTPLPPLIGRKVKLTRNGRQWKGCCPFHNEKTPSFYVYDDHYHCFGCGQHGDAIGFTMQTEGLPFREAVERLAHEAGLEVPKESPRQAAREARAKDLHEVLAAAAEAMQRWLRAPEGREGLDYLKRRGLTDETIARFGLGWSGTGRGVLAEALKPLGIEPRQLAEAGLSRPVEGREGVFNDFFYNRVMFPIRDKRGRIVSFGGRILGDGQPKYLNGPETDVFSKRRTLYGLDLAREAVFRGKARLIVAEGYMDVIALHQAGFEGAVAPLGTALTPEQMEEIWRVSPEPVLCLDADAAGLRAASRTAEMVMPLLGTERTLRFATVEGGKDPDELIRAKGPAAFQAVLDAARPLSVALYDLMSAGRPLESPEGRAAFRNDLAAAANQIPDKALAAEYRRALLDRFFETTRPQRPQRPQGGAAGFAPRGGRPGFKPPPRLPPRPSPGAESARLEQARCLLAITLTHPWLLNEVEEAFALLELPHGPPSALQAAMLAWHAGQVLAEEAQNLTEASNSGGSSLDSADLVAHLDATGLNEARAWVMRATGLPREARPDAQPGESLAGWWHFFGFLRGEGALVEDLVEARRELEAANDAAAQARVIRLSQALSALRRGETGLEEGAESAAP
ncbi:DNA primase [Roseomonas sp. SSH11]|uniref:DNA primase n=1 Tax=Pararoseomonas baculiformis TaxID=2820812 RepID=A0ABS4ADJ9_9PROT|nr:DNA primase [Pararoseomonas baculiformis]MBP0444926.1 DNA primase [Pararoseomonas baculiformis]